MELEVEKVSKLYKNRYLIAMYDMQDEWILTYDNVDQISKDLGLDYFETVLSRRIREQGTFPIITIGRRKFCFIDVLEEHNDCFKEDDKKFMEFIEKRCMITIADFCRERGIPERSFYRNVYRMRGKLPYKYKEEIDEYYSIIGEEEDERLENCI